MNERNLACPFEILEQSLDQSEIFEYTTLHCCMGETYEGCIYGCNKARDGFAFGIKSL